MKKVKLVTSLLGGFLVFDFYMLASIVGGQWLLKQIKDAYEAGVTDKIDSLTRGYGIFTVVLLVGTIGLATVMSNLLFKAFREPVNMLVKASEDVRKGKVDIELKKTRDDEMGQIIDAFQGIIDNIRYQASLLETMSNGDFTVDVKVRSEEDLLGNSLKKLVDNNSYAISNISEAAYQVFTSSTQVANASESLAQGSTEQASAIEEITSSVNEIAVKTKENAIQANEAADLMKAAIKDVKQGNDEMQEMMGAMQEINKASENISKIIKAIDDIAFQTNILALNAAVEAAKAGEAGKGFAVVAEEVRNLAAKSGAAAAETAELIENSINKVSVGTKIADETAKALKKITDVVSQSEQIVVNIAEASNYQATAVAQVDQAIGQVSQVVQTNSATSEECAAASEELTNQAELMRELLAGFKAKS